MAVRILSGSSRIRVANTKKSADAHRSKGWIFLPGIGSQEKLEIIAFKCCLFAIYRRDAVATMLGTAFSGAASLLPNGGNVQTAYNQLQAQLTNAFSEAVTVNGNNQFLITGGTNEGGSYVPADWGLLYGVGQLIFSTIWTWPSDTKRLKTAMQQSYCVTVAQALLAASPPV